MKYGIKGRGWLINGTGSGGKIVGVENAEDEQLLDEGEVGTAAAAAAAADSNDEGNERVEDGVAFVFEEELWAATLKYFDRRPNRESKI